MLLVANRWLGAIAEGARSLRRSPAFSLLVVATLALGIGTNTTMLALLNAVLFSPPAHVEAPEELYTPTLTIPRGTDVPFTTEAQSFPVAQALRRDSVAFAGAAMYEREPLSWSHGDETRPLVGLVVSDNYFQVLGVGAVRGRFFDQDDDAQPTGRAVAVISETFWRTALGGRPEIIGSTVTLDRTPYTIIGVAPGGFAGTGTDRADVWLPVTAVKVSLPGGFALLRHSPGLVWLHMVARLRKGVTAGAAAAMATLAARGAYPPGNPGAAAASITLHSILPWRSSLTAASKIAAMLAAVSLFVLLIACVNVATLMLRRSAKREGEFGIRVALGATPRRMASNVLVEALILAAAGGAVAVVMMLGVGPAVLRLVDRDPQALLVMDWRDFVIALAMVLLVAAATALTPALGAARRDPAAALRRGRGGASRSGQGARRTLLALQCAACVTLVSGAGMFALSVRRVAQIHLGVDAANVWVAPLLFADSPYNGPRADVLARDLLDRANALPGVVSASLASVAPLSIQSIAVPTDRPGHDSLPSLGGGPYIAGVEAGYFRTVGTGILRGRGIDAGDRASARPVAVISNTVATSWFHGEDPLGQCIQIGGDEAPCTVVVGVAEEVQAPSLEAGSARPMIYLPLEQTTRELVLGTSLLVRTSGGDPSVALGRLVNDVAPDLPYAPPRSLRSVMLGLSASWRVGATLLMAFAILALIVAGVGIYGSFAFAVAQRRREIGIRVALGARGANLVRMVEGEGLAIAGIGVALGLLAVLAAAPLVGPLLFRVSPTDPAALAAAVGLVIVVTAGSCLIPAWRATQVAPGTVLRSE